MRFEERTGFVASASVEAYSFEEDAGTGTTIVLPMLSRSPPVNRLASFNKLVVMPYFFAIVFDGLMWTLPGLMSNYQVYWVYGII